MTEREKELEKQLKDLEKTVNVYRTLLRKAREEIEKLKELIRLVAGER